MRLSGRAGERIWYQRSSRSSHKKNEETFLSDIALCTLWILFVSAVPIGS